MELLAARCKGRETDVCNKWARAWWRMSERELRVEVCHACLGADQCVGGGGGGAGGGGVERVSREKSRQIQSGERGDLNGE